ncbi:hypothetical protein PIB30_041707 [Stylosanthes scabra]|uniref:Uncharacterized protein n=1 Tax=Stylosanthes scabra TaxID=79078 RepID=A0ABU6VHX3_9FABA|nr:hypothetical protein [Stylosanthes scabra]
MPRGFDPNVAPEVLNDDSMIQRLLSSTNWMECWADSQPGLEQVPPVHPTSVQATPILVPALSGRRYMDCRPQPRRTTSQSSGRRSVDSRWSGCAPRDSVFNFVDRQNELVIKSNPTMTFDLNESAPPAEGEDGEVQQYRMSYDHAVGIEIGYDPVAHIDDISSDHAYPSNPSHSGNGLISASLLPLVLMLD